jgi:acyl-CoA reductase-like NAD-dependent aldehyde dehydrogenase
MTMSALRLDVRKTYKLFIGGNFVRSESGRSLCAKSPSGKLLDNFCHASRKDLRDAVTAARPAAEGWAKKSAYLRGQILYRAAEMLEDRASAMTEEIVRSTGATGDQACTEVALAVDRLVYFAGWTDKFAQVFGAVNPVASSHFNFSIPEPTGVVAVLAPDEPSLLPLISLAAPAVLTGNSVVAIASEKFPLPALTFAEILATSDLPGGVINILAGKRGELLPHLAGHMDINAIVNASGVEEAQQVLQAGTAVNLKRYASRNMTAEDWFTETAENPYWIADTVEFKTAWHPIGL